MSAPASGPVAALRRLGAMGALSGLTLGGVMVQAAPMGPLPDAPMPDLAWCVLAFFVLRRPAAAPLGLVALLLVMRDALLGGPLGAGALSLLLASEALRWRAKELPPPRSVWGDWVWASLGYAGALGLQWLLMAISLGHPPALLALGPHLGATVLAIPVVAGILRYGMRIGASPRQDDEGRRLPARRLPPRRLGKGAS